MNAALLFTALVVCTATSANERASAEVSSDDQQLLSDAADGTFDNGSLLATALNAAGRTNIDRKRLLGRFDIWIESLTLRQPPLPNEPSALTAELFARLHRDILTGAYCATCSDVGVTLDTGDFNCLTATILFIAAGRRFDLEVAALATEGHVFCQIGDESSPQRIETTCAQWFNLSDAAAPCAASGCPHGATGRGARPLSDVQLVAKVYYNRGVSRLRVNDFPHGLALTRLSLLLDPEDHIARGNVLAGLNNWSLQLCRQGEHARALELIEQVRCLDANYPTLEENTAHIYRCWAQQSRAADTPHPAQPEKISESRLPRPRLQPIY